MSEEYVRRKPGMGIASRFTLGLGLVASVVAVAASLLLLNGIDEIGGTITTAAQVEMASETARLNALNAERSGDMYQTRHTSQSGLVVQVGKGKVDVDGETVDKIIVMTAPANTGGQNSISEVFYAPLDSMATGATEDDIKLISELDPKNEHGLMIMVVISKMGSLGSIEDLPIFVALAEKLHATGNVTADEDSRSIYITCAFFCAQYLDDEANAKVWAQRATDLGGLDERMQEVVDGILEEAAEVESDL